MGHPVTIYTAIFGDYDDLKEPLVITPGWRYICFTDQPLQSNVWEIVMVPTESAIFEAKRFKIMPPVSGPSIYIDGTFIVNCDLNKFFTRIKGVITFIQHPKRRCVYKEANACVTLNKVTGSSIFKQIQEYKREGLPLNNGMAASGIILRSGEYDNGFCELWWTKFRQGCSRDQISWAYANWKIKGSHINSYNYGSGLDFLHIPHLSKQQKRNNRYEYYKKMGVIKLAS